MSECTSHVTTILVTFRT